MRAFVATDKCQGHARCYAVAPNVFEIDDNGYNTTEEVAVAPAEEETARLGAASCPERAITVDE